MNREQEERKYRRGEYKQRLQDSIYETTGVNGEKCLEQGTRLHTPLAPLFNQNVIVLADQSEGASI